VADLALWARYERWREVVVEGACPLDGGRLERRDHQPYGFCIECGEGWSATSAENGSRVLGRLGARAG
jgi:hypothetical protein